ncbi:DUF1501 domain-containing protein [Thalassoroseus pseudoceratinae]|uniref:DUF1501 domain-containing protein n=1 Tax=Thalassoroseus pseudoceratinae TaxID=2713176 RepID=UPI001422B6FB|nr:DUF1501 domain-containing protein [Thalassoroseus pseudoceratinae]
MLTILGPKHSSRSQYCDGVSRRSFLKIGGLAMGAAGGLSLPQILRAESATKQTVGDIQPRQKSVINIFLGGGPPHQDMWDIKTDAPAEIRGEFMPISTNVPGIQIGECFPKIASMFDKFTAIRSIVGCAGGHDAFQCMTGWNRRDLESLGGRPCIGSALARLRGPIDPGIPAAVALAEKTRHVPWSFGGDPGFLGPAYQPFKPNGEGKDDLTLNNITLDRLGDRKKLLRELDTLKRNVDANGMMTGMDAFSEAAFGVLTSSKLADALDLSQEPEEVRARYGDGKPYKFQYDGAPTVNEHVLLARRLVEAGVRCVSLSYGRWDSHGKNFDMVRDHGGKLDQCVSALVEDLHERGMLDDVSIVVWGEFGRTPKVNTKAGRDHWPRVSCALLAGGGMQHGQVIGATNRLGEYAVDRPVDVQEVITTLYHSLGIDPMSTTVLDPSGRPQYLVDIREPIRELV